MAINRYFQNLTYGREQDLVEDLIIESIKIYGHDVRYIPRTLINEDRIFWEDRLSQFLNAVELEMYIKNVEGFEGEGDFLSRFNLEIRDQITFTVARRRFDEATSMKMLTERGDVMVSEAYDVNAPSRQFLSAPHDDSEEFAYEANTFGYYTITRNRPQEGDLIFFPLNQKLFEIKYVEHEDVFYQTGRLQTYDIRCELFEYASERLDTGNTIIDAIETKYTSDIIPENAMLFEDGENMLLEDGDFMVFEYAVETTQFSADNTQLETEALSGIIDFSEKNPFSEDF